MTDEIRVEPFERRDLITDEAYAPPKYTFYAIDAAVQYSGATSKSNIGDINELFAEFKEENPEGTFDDWKQFYLHEIGGEPLIDEVTEEAYHMFLKLREAIEQIDNQDIREFIQDLILNKTYSQRNIEEAIIEKLVNVGEVECTYPSPDSDPEVDLLYQGNPVILQEADAEIRSNVECMIFRYSERDDRSIVVDLSEINRSLSDF